MNWVDPALPRRAFLGSIGLGTVSLALSRSPAQSAPSSRAESISDDWAAANALAARIESPVFPERTLRADDLGAKPDGRTDCRTILQSAVDRLNAAGGGRLVIPSGVWWLDGPLHLKSRIHLHLEIGATLRFSSDPKRYLPLVLTRWEGTEAFNYSPCLYAYQASHVAVTGQGTIDGNAAELCVDWRTRQKPAKALIRELGARGAPVHERVFGEGHWLRWPLVQFFGCDHVLLEDFTAVQSPFWCLHTVSCRHVILRRLRVEGAHLNNDCFDPESSSFVLVEHCRFRSGDDCIAIKSGRDQDGWRVGVPAEDIVIRHCDLESTTAAALAIGSEMSGGVRRVYVEHCRMGQARYALNFKGNLDRGGIVEHVRMRHLTVGTAREQLIQFTSDYQGLRGSSHPPTFRNFVLEDITCQDALGTALHFLGAPGAPVSDVVLRNITVERAVTPLTHLHVERLTFDRVRINQHSVATPSS